MPDTDLAFVQHKFYHLALTTNLPAGRQGAQSIRKEKKDLNGLTRKMQAYVPYVSMCLIKNRCTIKNIGT